jgi:hypothetical protein
MYAYPRPSDLAYPAQVLSAEGRFLEAIFNGQSESWPDRGAPERSTRLVAKVERREALRPTSLGAHGWRYQLCEAKRLLRLKGCAACTSWRLPPLHPLARFARDWQSSDALRRENTDAWLFEILKKNLSETPQHAPRHTRA